MITIQFTSEQCSFLEKVLEHYNQDLITNKSKSTETELLLFYAEEQSRATQLQKIIHETKIHHGTN